MSRDDVPAAPPEEVPRAPADEAPRPSADEAPRPPADEPWRVLALVAGASATLVAGQLVVSPLLPAIIETLDISAAAAGLALSTLAATLALARFPGGRLADDLGPKTTLVASFALAGLGFGLLALARDVVGFVAALAVLGVGAGLYMPAAVTLLSRRFAARRARAFGIHEVAINVGGVLAGVLAVVTLAVGPWQAAFLPVLVALAVVTALTHRWARGPYRVERVGLDLRATVRRLLADRSTRSMLVAFSLLSFVWQGLANFLPTFLVAAKGFAPGLASQAFTGLFLAGIAVNVAVSRYGDRGGPARVATAAVGVAAAGVALLVVAGSVPAAVAGILLFGVGGGAFWPLMVAALMATLPDGSAGGDYGAVSTAFMAVGSLGPAFVGVTADRLGYEAAFAGLVVCLLGGLVATAVLARRESA